MAVRGDRLTVAMTTFAQELHKAIGERSVYQAATDWGIPHWILRDSLSGKIDCPSPRYLLQIARGMDWTVEQVIEAVYPVAVPA